MPNQQITVNSRKYDGSIRRTWTCELTESVGDLHKFLGVFDRDVDHDELGLIRKGTISHEYYWLSRWFNVFRFHEPDGTFRNFYCNIGMPPTFEGGVLDYVDLDIDVLVDNDFSYKVLDRKEFEANRKKFQYSAEILLQVENNLRELIRMIESKEFPFCKNF